jgi:hypothetical protein
MDEAIKLLLRICNGNKVDAFPFHSLLKHVMGVMSFFLSYHVSPPNTLQTGHIESCDLNPMP